tara:strand:- start:873 stop:1022 length:150 start_codon:yes stop_codon:yes gene_type:complete
LIDLSQFPKLKSKVKDEFSKVNFSNKYQNDVNKKFIVLKIRKWDFYEKN